jgi:sirohydrochlorin cobaltochelatase
MLGVIILAHGSRDPLWRAPIEAIAQQVARRDPYASVCCAYLELSDPDMASAVAGLADKGVTTIRVMPLFFGMGKHAREDLPVIMETMATTYPGVHFELLPTAGEDSRMTALLASIALETPAP